MINSKNIFITVLFIIFCSAAFAQEVFKNDEVTVSKLDKGVYVMETFDKTTMYIVEGAKRALLIDTGTKCDSLDKIVRKITSKPFDVVLTHNHGDHSGNIQYFDEVYMHPADTVLELNKKFTGKYKWLNEGDVFDLGGGRKIETLLMPGHTPGSVVLLDKTINAVYTGDAFGSGHVWLQLRPHLSMKIYHKSCVRMEKIMQEQNITKIYCGHYPSVKHAFGMSYIIEMKNLAEKISAGDTVGSQPYSVPSRNNKAVFLQDGEALIVFDPENINDRKDVLILLVHPDIKTSKANAALINAVKDFPYVKIINMYDEPFVAETYKDAFAEARNIVFQFPLYWASSPYLLKKWCDEIFGSIQANSGVKGKKLMVVTTTGSEYEAYRAGARNQFTIDELLRPYQLTANHSGMIWKTPFAVYGTSLPDADKRIQAGANVYRKVISDLVNK